MKTDKKLDIPILDDIMGFIDYTVVQVSRETAMKWRALLNNPPSWIRVTGIHTKGPSGHIEDSASVSEVGRGSVNLKIVHYGRGKYTLCLRGSPTKVDSGQNVVSCGISKSAGKLQEELNSKYGRTVRDEEVLVIQMYLLVNEKIQSIEGLLSAREIESVRRGKILISNLTYAAYVKLGETEEERNQNFHTLCAVMRSEVVFGKGSMQVSNFIKRGSKVRAFKSSSEGDPGFERFTGMLMTMEVNGLPFAKMMMYQKDREIESQGTKPSNQGNTLVRA